MNQYIVIYYYHPNKNCSLFFCSISRYVVVNGIGKVNLFKIHYTNNPVIIFIEREIYIIISYEKYALIFAPSYLYCKLRNNIILMTKHLY